VIEFARRVATDPKRVDDARIEALREAGFDNPAIVRLLTVAAAAVAANAIADALNVHPQDRADPFQY
jgi:alkylhydroperoxidase family enzyme